MLRNFTLEDASPLIQYDEGWVDGYNSTADLEMPRYEGRSFQCTDVDGATASITFNGTAIYLYGAKRNNHGYYHITLDDQDTIPMSGQPANSTIEEFQTLLFARQGLENGKHTLKLQNVHENKDRVYVDIDFIIITREVDDTLAEAQSVIATHDDFAYSSLWKRQTGMESYRNGTAHTTNTPGETATLKFHGPEILLYGAVGPTFGTFRVQVDDQEPNVFSATKRYAHHPLTLFRASGLGNGQHTLSITNIEGGKTLTIDYASYIAQAESSGSSNAGLIGGVVGGVVGAIVLIAALWYFIRRRKRARHDQPLPPMSTNPFENDQIQVTPYFDEPNQPPLGYVALAPSLHAPSTGTTRKPGMLVSSQPTLRSEESSYGPSSHRGLSSTGSPTDAASIHEVDAGTLPPMYHQVFSPPPLPRDAGATT